MKLNEVRTAGARLYGHMQQRQLEPKDAAAAFPRSLELSAHTSSYKHRGLRHLDTENKFSLQRQTT